MSMILRLPTRARGFTLIEVILVLALTTILILLSLSYYTAFINSTAIATSADVVSDVFMDARSSATAQNTTVEVRIYNLPTSSGGASTYGALQLRWLKPDGTTPPVMKPVFLPSSVAIDATAEHSPLIGGNTQTATPDTSDLLINSQTRAFHFLPDGSTDLNSSTNWFLTIRSATQSDPAHFPSNWACVRVDAVTGHVQTYRP